MIGKLIRAITKPQILRNYVNWKAVTARVAIHNALGRKHHHSNASPVCLPDLAQIEERRKLDTDISDHLPSLFAETVNARPELIVELGVRGGDSTFVLERAARFCNAHLISVDID